MSIIKLSNSLQQSCLVEKPQVARVHFYLFCLQLQPQLQSLLVIMAKAKACLVELDVAIKQWRRSQLNDYLLTVEA